MSERDYENDEQQGGRPGLPVDPLRIWNALRRRWQLVLIAGVIGAFLGAAIAKKFVERTFSSSGIITWTVHDERYTPETREAIVESILIPSRLEEVRRRLKLDVPTQVLARTIKVAPSQKSNNIVIEAVETTADGAATLVNTVIDVFLDSRMKVNKDALKAEADRYREAVVGAERARAEASRAYDDFRRQSGISDISIERELAIAEAAKIAAEADKLTKLQSSAGDEGAPGPVPTGGPTLATAQEAEQLAVDRKRLPEARAELALANKQFSSDHPQVRRLQAELEALEARISRNTRAPRDNRQTIERRQKEAKEAQDKLAKRLNSLSEAEAKAAVLLGAQKVQSDAVDAAKAMLTQKELESQSPPSEFRILERATPPDEALDSPRKKIALGFPIGFVVLATIGVIIGSLRKLDVRTPKEAAFWSGVPVVGASTWPRDPDMLSSLMHDLDDYAPHCEGVTLIVGASLDEAHLARRVAEWDGHRIVKSVDDPQRLLAAGQGGSSYPLAKAGPGGGGGGEGGAASAASNMQILTLTGPVPAQALRRAARLADRVLVVVASGKHNIFQLTKIKGRLGRDNGIGVLLVGLDKEYAMVRDRVGEIERFWHATRAAGS